MAQREFVELDPGLLPRLEAIVESLIELCDQLSGDPDREDDETEIDDEI